MRWHQRRLHCAMIAIGRLCTSYLVLSPSPSLPSRSIPLAGRWSGEMTSRWLYRHSRRRDRGSPGEKRLRLLGGRNIPIPTKFRRLRAGKNRPTDIREIMRIPRALLCRACTNTGKRTTSLVIVGDTRRTLRPCHFEGGFHTIRIYQPIILFRECRLALCFSPKLIFDIYTQFLAARIKTNNTDISAQGPNN